MTIHIITIFPELIKIAFNYGVIGQAIKKRVLEIVPVNLRDFTTDKHKTVDGRPFGGGPGMVMRIDIIDKAVSSIKNALANDSSKNKAVLLSASGPIFTQQKALQLSHLDNLILISGRYEGVDDRVRQHLADEELSIGKYVLSGGEIPAMVVTDTVARLLPGVVGDPGSIIHESYSDSEDQLDFPQYTHPKVYRGWEIPQILTSGHHAKINQWRKDKTKNAKA